MTNLNKAELEENEILIPFADMVQQLVDYGEPIEDPLSDRAMTIEKVKVEMPVEFQVLVGNDGKAILKSNAPTQSTATTVMPVFHRLKLTVEMSKE